MADNMDTKKKRVCMFFNDLALYRKAIYKMLDEEYDCEWYIEDVDTGVKEFDASELKHVRRLPVRQYGRFYIVKGLLPLLRRDFDVYFVLGATGNISLFIFCLFKRLFYSQKRIYFWTHGFYGKESKLELLLWKRPLCKLPDGLFPYSEYAKNLMVQDGFSSNKIYPIHNSLAYDEQLALRKALAPSDIYITHFGNNNPILVMIGRLNLRKHLDLLFYAVNLLKQKGESYNIVLIGDGEDKLALEKLVEEKGLEKETWFFGACYDENKNAELLFNADMCVVPGDIGLTAIHSLMFGVPAITHNCFKYQGPEFEAIISGKTGYFYEYGSVDSLANAISTWFKEHKDREIVRKDCYNEIDSYWNPYFQMDVIRKNLI